VYCGYITILKQLREHNNADRLLCTEVFGNNVIVDKNYKEGQKVVFFPIDGALGKEYAEENNLVRKKDETGKNIGGFLDPDKRNIKALKLRGERSEGLVMPIESLSKYTDISKLKSGDQITVLNGVVICEKYIPKQQQSVETKSKNKQNKRTKQTKKESYPIFKEHIDTAQLVYNMNAFKPGDTIYLTLKMHGTSGRTQNALKVTTEPNLIQKILKKSGKSKKEWVYVSGTRRTIINTFDNDCGYYGTNHFRKQYHDFFIDKLPKGFEVFYEIVGYIDGTEKSIMGKCSNALVKDKAFSKKYGKETVFSYGCEVGESDFYIYRITHTNEDGVVTEIPWEVVKILCDKWGCKHVPELEKFLFTTEEDLMERINKYLDMDDPIGKTHVNEGVVIRIDNREHFTAYKHKSWFFKILEGIIKDNSDAPDMEEAEELITEEDDS
jgi:tRNA-binding EMAP/Myf-like protein